MREVTRSLPALLAVGVLLGACQGRTGRAAAPDAAADARGRSDISVARNDEGQIVRVIVRKGRLDAEMAAKLRDLKRLESLELYDVTPTPEAWRELECLTTLRLLKIRAAAVDFANLQRLAAERPELTVDCPWPVILSPSGNVLSIWLPMVHVVCEDMSPLAGFRVEFTIGLSGTSRRAVKIPLPAPRADVPYDPRVYILPRWSYCLEDGVGFVVPHYRSFLVSNDASTVTIGDRSFPIVDRERTVVIDEDGHAELYDFQLMLEGETPFFTGGEEVLLDRTVERRADAAADAGAKNQVSPSNLNEKATLTSVQARIVRQYHESQTRSLTYIAAYHRVGWVYSLSPNVNFRSGDVAGAVSWRYFGPGPRPPGECLYYPDIGLNLLFKHPDAVMDSGLAPSPSSYLSCCSPDSIRTKRLRGDRWRMFGKRSTPAPPLQMQAIFSPDEGDLVFNLGDFSPEGDFRVDGKCRHVIVGDKTVELTPGVATTIFLSGDKSKGEPLRVDRVEAEEKEPPGE
jgi:hypothetical protein